MLILFLWKSTGASAAITHKYEQGPSETISKGAPEKGPKGETVGLPGPLLGVEATTVDLGHLWLAEDVKGESGAFRIDEFNSGSGAFEAQLPPAPATLHNVREGLAVGHVTGERELYLAVKEGTTPVVALFGASGAAQPAWTGAGTPSGSFKPNVASVAVDGKGSSVGDWAAGDVYVSATEPSETGGGVVDVIEPHVNVKGEDEEKYVTQIIGTCPTEATTCTPAEEAEHPFEAPGHVAVSAVSGEVFVLDGERAVDVFRPVEVAGVKTFEYVRRFAAPAGVNLTRLKGIAVDGTEGDVYLASELGALYEFTSEGRFLGRITETSAGPLGSLLSVAVDQESHDVFLGEFGVIKVLGANLTIPSVKVGPPPTPAPTEVTLAGTVNSEDAGEATCAFEYGTTTAYGEKAECSGLGSVLDPVPSVNVEEPVHSASVSVSPDTTYYYRLAAKNASGIVNPGEGPEDEGTFKTAGPGIFEESATEVSSTSVKLHAQVDPDGAATSYYFQYGEQSVTEHTAPTEALGSGVQPVPVSLLVQENLSPGTVYRYRVVAVSEIEPGKIVDFDGSEATFTTQGVGSFGLPDGRQWELVSPPDKHGASLLPINERGVMQAAADGDAMTYVASDPTESGPAGYAEGVQVFSTRGPDGWQSRDMSLPHEAATRLSGGDGFEFRFFSEDLERGIVQPFGDLVKSAVPEASEQTALLATDYLNGNVNEPCLPASASCYTPLVTRANDTAKPFQPFGNEAECSGATPEAVLCGPHFLDATPDAQHVIVSSCPPQEPSCHTALTSPPAPESGGLYEWTAGKLAPVSVLPAGAGAAPFPALGSSTAGIESPGARGAISADGARVFWSTTTGEKHLYVRDTSKEETLALDTAQAGCAEPQECKSGGGVFQIASADGSIVYFTDTQRLTPNAGTSGADLYEARITEEPGTGKLKVTVTDVTPPGPSGEPADIQGTVIGASGDGSSVYFVAEGVLSNSGVPVAGAVHGDCESGLSASPSQTCNLYVRHAGVTRLVAVLSGADMPDWAGAQNLATLTARVSPDGHWLAFMSQRSLTGYDNHDAVTGAADEEVYLYDGETGRLTCASCNPTGARPIGEEALHTWSSGEGLVGGDHDWDEHETLAANVPGWTPFEVTVARYQSRYLSNSGRLFFNSRDSLVPRDVNENWDVYEYEPENVPSGKYGCTASSASGSTVFRPAHAFTAERVNQTEAPLTGEEGAGCVGLISSGESPQESAFLDASESGGEAPNGEELQEGGSDVFFLTSARLTSQDYDNSIDVYDAHECTTASPCPPQSAEAPPPCDTEASCKASPTPQPEIYGAPSSATFNGLGNITPTAPAVVKKKTAAEVRAEDLKKALKKCKTDKKKKKRATCEAKAKKLYGPVNKKGKKKK
jgi:hypothetical protein